jgi:hypothetical protein
LLAVAMLGHIIMFISSLGIIGSILHLFLYYFF